MREHDHPGHGLHDMGADRMTRDDRAAIEEMTTAELKRMCTDLSIAAALLVPGGAGQATIQRQLGIFNSEGADAASRGFRPPRPGTGGAADAPGALPVTT